MVWKRTRIGCKCLSVALLSGWSAALCQAAPGPSLHDQPGAAAGETHSASPQYIGSGSCGASACHGSIQPRSTTRVLQNEYSTWIASDKHAHAYKALTDPLGQQIGVVLKLAEPPEKSQRCLVCHALSVTPAQRAREFDLAEGVGCESCHGPASLWLGPHIQPTADHRKMVALGLIDNRDLAVRAEKCLTCHLGAPGMTVDHELIAAGHPDLTFELDSFTAVEPPHWVEKASNGGPIDPLFGVKAWAVGQMVELQQSMLRVSGHAKSGPWPEFSEMDCVSCHHALTGPGSWRQQAGFQGHRPGDPSYNLSRYVLLRHFAAEVDPSLNDRLAVEIGRVNTLVTGMSADRAAVESAANRAAELAGQMVPVIRDAPYDNARTERLLRSITGDADAIAFAGERTAEQATMTVDSLYIAQAKAGSENPATRQAIDGLFHLVDNPSAYNGPQFAAQMKRVRSTLR